MCTPGFACGPHLPAHDHQVDCGATRMLVAAEAERIELGRLDHSRVPPGCRSRGEADDAIVGRSVGRRRDHHPAAGRGSVDPARTFKLSGTSRRPAPACRTGGYGDHGAGRQHVGASGERLQQLGGQPAPCAVADDDELRSHDGLEQHPRRPTLGCPPLHPNGGCFRHRDLDAVPCGAQRAVAGGTLQLLAGSGSARTIGVADDERKAARCRSARRTDDRTMVRRAVADTDDDPARRREPVDAQSGTPSQGPASARRPRGHTFVRQIRRIGTKVPTAQAFPRWFERAAGANVGCCAGQVMSGGAEALEGLISGRVDRGTRQSCLPVRSDLSHLRWDLGPFICPPAGRNVGNDPRRPFLRR
jgi:hypothetical protein